MLRAHSSNRNSILSSRHSLASTLRELKIVVGRKKLSFYSIRFETSNHSITNAAIRTPVSAYTTSGLLVKSIYMQSN